MANEPSGKEKRRAVIAKARKALESFGKMPQPLSFTDTGPGEPHNLPGAQTGSIRAADGRALFVPVSESSSMLAAFPFVFDFFIQAPRLIEELTEALELEDEMATPEPER
jgi:hypothetical protein